MGRENDGAVLLSRVMAAHVDHVVDWVGERLRLLDSPLVTDDDLWAQFVSQVRSILAATAARLGAAGPLAAPEAAAMGVEICAARVKAGIHPRESLRAARLVFEAALPVMLREFAPGAQTVGGVEAIALVLHAEIMERVTVAAVPYMSFLLHRMHTAQFDERRRIARELHDDVAHAVGVAMQQVELYDAYAERDQEHAEWRLRAARESLSTALARIRGLSDELGRSPTEYGLGRALARYLDANVPPTVEVSLTSSPGIDSLPSEIGDQLYYVLREAVRNALIHANTAELRVTLDVVDDAVVAAVEDSGCGLDVPQALSASRSAGSGRGLTSMHERIELLGGVFTLASTPGRGTRAEMLVPLATVSQ